MSFFNIPDIFHIGENIRHRFESHYERPVGYDLRNSILLAPLEESLTNLQNIRESIVSLIENGTASGTDMTLASTSLADADRQLSYAEQMVAIATSTISGSDPKPAYLQSQAAYVSLIQARNSLDTVLNNIDSVKIKKVIEPL